MSTRVTRFDDDPATVRNDAGIVVPPRLDAARAELRALWGAERYDRVAAHRSDDFVRGALDAARACAQLDAKDRAERADAVQRILAMQVADAEILAACLRRREEARLNGGVVRRDGPLTPREAMIERNSRLTPISELALDERGEFILPAETPARADDARHDGRSPRERFLEAQRTRYTPFARTDSAEPEAGGR